MTDLAGVQEAYKQLLQQATAQFDQTVQQATQQMAEMIKQAAEEVPVESKPKAKQMDGGLWLNKEAVETLLEVLEQIETTLKNAESA